MIPLAAIFIITALGFFLFSFMLERPWLKWWSIPFVILAGLIIYGRIAGYL